MCIRDSACSDAHAPDDPGAHACAHADPGTHACAHTYAGIYRCSRGLIATDQTPVVLRAFFDPVWQRGSRLHGAVTGIWPPQDRMVGHNVHPPGTAGASWSTPSSLQGRGAESFYTGPHGAAPALPGT